MKLPSDFAKEIAKSLGMSDKWVDEWFDVEEDKEGYFVAKLKAKKFLERDQFRTVCTLARDLGGEGYLQGARAWKIPGPIAKKPLPQTDTTSTPGPTDARSKSESEPEPKPEVIEGLDIEIVEGLRKSREILGELYPVIVDETGTRLSGRHRVAAGWAGRIIVDSREIAKKLGLDPEDDGNRAIAQILVVTHSNYQRRVSEEETRKNLLALAQILELKGIPKERICAKVSELVPYSERWVRQLLPEQYKMPTKAEVLPLPTSEVHPKFVPCARCGVATSEPVHLSGKFYCEKCAETIATQTQTEAQPESEPSKEEPEGIEEPEEEEEHVQPPEPKPEPLLTGFEVECPECHKKLLINHVEWPNGKVLHEVEG